MKNILVVIAASIAISGCSTLAYTNTPQTDSPVSRATFNIQEPRGEEKVLVMLALSGGGSRAAYFSGAVMLQLQKVFEDEGLDLLQEVDVISSVSGGSLPAAYYAISFDRAMRLHGEPPPALGEHPKLKYDVGTKELRLDGELTPTEEDAARAAFTDPKHQRQFNRLVAQKAVASNRPWDAPTVKRLMERNYLSRWFGNWFWPDNILLYWATAYDRSDIMAQTFADNLYDVNWTGRDLTFQDINPERPYLILNATSATERVKEKDQKFGSVFTFTNEDFRQVAKSDINSYNIARGVMASAAFPGVFNYMTLRNYTTDSEHYLHFFDGGNSDNLGLTSLKRILLDKNVNAPKSYRKIIMILVDSYVHPTGVDRDEYEGRCVFCYVIDLNVTTAVDSLLEANRDNLLQDFKGNISVVKDCDKRNLPADICDDPTLKKQIAMVESKLFFYHVRFEDSRHKDKLEKISTNFRITDDKEGKPNTEHLDAAAKELITDRNDCLQRIRRVIEDKETAADAESRDRYCTWSPR